MLSVSSSLIGMRGPLTSAFSVFVAGSAIASRQSSAGPRGLSVDPAILPHRFSKLVHAGFVPWAAEPMPLGLCPLESRCVGERAGRAVTIEENPRLRESCEAATDVNTQLARRRRRVAR